jgi:hypothetical protein
MNAAIKLSVLGLVTFFVALIVRWAFFWNVEPLSAEQSPPPTGALEAAFLLLSIQNVGAAVGMVALLVAAALWIGRFYWAKRWFGKTRKLGALKR